MSTTPKPDSKGKDPGQDLANFERLPEETKDLLKLKDRAEKATGAEEVAITREMEEKARKKRP